MRCRSTSSRSLQRIRCAMECLNLKAKLIDAISDGYLYQVRERGSCSGAAAEAVLYLDTASRKAR